jgi:hypothetical protein
LASGCVTTAYDPGSGGGASGGTGGGASGGSGGGGSGGGGGGATGTPKSGTISADETWSGAISVTGDVTIASGATVTIADGTLIQVGGGFQIIVNGAITVSGTAAAGVSFMPNPTPGTWDGIQVNAGGKANLSWATFQYPTTALACASGAAICQADHIKVTNFTATGITVQSAATFAHITVETGGAGGLLESAGAADTVTITDSIFHHTGGDAVIVSSGNLTLSYSHIYGDAAGGNSGVHCATHITTTGVVLADHNILEDANYGLMASSMAATSKLNLNNILGYGSGTTGGAYIEATPGVKLDPGVDLTNNYWNGQAPPTNTGTTLVTTTYQNTQVPGCGPRP